VLTTSARPPATLRARDSCIPRVEVEARTSHVSSVTRTLMRLRTSSLQELAQLGHARSAGMQSCVRQPLSKIYEDTCSATSIEQAADGMGISERDSCRYLLAAELFEMTGRRHCIREAATVENC
jgi:hypothetical protein